jgi:hypothetical protein
MDHAITNATLFGIKIAGPSWALFIRLLQRSLASNLPAEFCARMRSHTCNKSKAKLQPLYPKRFRG